MSPLLGGEIVVVFLAVRIALWIWRSRAEVGAILGGDGGPPGPEGGRPVEPVRPPLRLAPRPPAVEPVSLPRAA